LSSLNCSSVTPWTMPSVPDRSYFDRRSISDSKEINNITYQVVAEVEVPLFQRYSLELHPILQLVLEHLPYQSTKNHQSMRTRKAGDDKNIVVSSCSNGRLGHQECALKCWEEGTTRPPKHKLKLLGNWLAGVHPPAGWERRIRVRDRGPRSATNLAVESRANSGESLRSEVHPLQHSPNQKSHQGPHEQGDHEP